MTVSKQDLLDAVEAFTTADNAHAEARTATLAAKDNTLSVTLIEQGQVDAALAHFDVSTNEAKADEATAVAAETAAESAEDVAKQELFDKIQEFAAQG